MSSGDLTPKQRLFVEKFCILRNQTQAAIAAGYSADTAESQGSRLLRNAKVAAAVQAATQAVTVKNGLTQEWVIQRLMQIAGVDMSDLASWNESGMRWKDSASLSDAAKASVQQIEQVMNEHGGTIKIKQYDRTTALKLLGQHLNMFKEQTEVRLTVDRPAEDVSDEELEREIEKR